MLKILSQQTLGSRGKSKSRNGSRCGSHGNNISAWTEGAVGGRREGEILLWWINIYLWKKITVHVCVVVCVWPTTERPTWWRRPTAGGWKSEAAPGQRRSEPAGGAPPGRSLTTRQMGLGWWWYVNDDMMTILKVLEESTQRAQREEGKSWKGGERRRNVCFGCDEVRRRVSKDTLSFILHELDHISSQRSQQLQEYCWRGYCMCECVCVCTLEEDHWK